MGSYIIKGRIFHTLEQKSSHCVLVEVQKGARCTCYTEMIFNSSFSPTIALLVHPSGTVHSHSGL